MSDRFNHFFQHQQQSSKQGTHLNWHEGCRFNLPGRCLRGVKKHVPTLGLLCVANPESKGMFVKRFCWDHMFKVASTMKFTALCGV